MTTEQKQIVDAPLDQKEIRRRLRSVSAEDFQKAHTKAVLTEMATTLGVENPSGTKQELYDAILANAGMPDQSLRGKSSVNKPVAQVWNFCDANREKIQSGELKRSKAVEQMRDSGIAYHTARTQYQCWFKATNKGERALADLDVSELPRELQPEEAAEADAS